MKLFSNARQCPLVKAYRGRTNRTDKLKFVVILKGPRNSIQLKLAPLLNGPLN